MEAEHIGIDIFYDDEKLNYGSCSEDELEEKSTFFSNFISNGEHIEDLIDSLDEELGIEVLNKNNIGLEDVSDESEGEELEEEEDEENNLRLLNKFEKFLSERKEQLQLDLYDSDDEIASSDSDDGGNDSDDGGNDSDDGGNDDDDGNDDDGGNDDAGIRGRSM